MIDVILKRSGAFLILSSLCYGGQADRLELGSRRTSLEGSEGRLHGSLQSDGEEMK